MSHERDLILEIKGNSLDDGPGIRTVVFFKGCPLNCVWCHNPESKKKVIELSWDSKECIGCQSCIKACPANAININNPYYIDRTRCTLCFKCVEECPPGALSRVGEYMTVDEIMKEILKDEPFFVTSGGGVTLSGGEPLINMDFVASLAREIKRNHIHLLIETSGYFNWDEFEKHIASYCDTIYYDIKLIDDSEHASYCGVSNAKILQNFKKLAEYCQKNNITLVPRTPLVPGITATEHNIKSILQFIRHCGVNTYELLRYNPLWPEKCAKIGMEQKIDDSLMRWMPHEEYEYYTKLVSENIK